MLRLEGRLAEASVPEAETHWTGASALAGGAPVTVDLRDVVGIDAAGTRLLARMRHDGATFVVAGCAMRALVAELNDEPDGVKAHANAPIARTADGKDVAGE